MNIIIPEILRNSHDQILQNKLEEFKHSGMNTTSDNSDMPIFKTIKTFAMNKSKYLIEITLLVGIFHSEIYGSAFVARTCDDYGLETLTASSKACYVLTNMNFAIQTFTTSALTMLGFNSNLMNKGIDITKLIKQFYEEYLKIAVEQHQNHHSVSRVNILKDIIEKNYASPNAINFRNIENIESFKDESRHFNFSGKVSSRNDHSDSRFGSKTKGRSSVLNNSSFNSKINSFSKAVSRICTQETSFCLIYI
jgi:hypothetical protein